MFIIYSCVCHSYVYVCVCLSVCVNTYRPLDLQFALRSATRVRRLFKNCPACKMIWFLSRHCAYRQSWESCVQDALGNGPSLRESSADDLYYLLCDVARRVSDLHRDEHINQAIKVA